VPFTRQRGDGRGSGAILFHEAHMCRAARQRLEPECATAGKQVQHACSRDARLQPVEQGFAHAIRCRSNFHAGGKAQSSATMATTNNAQNP